MSPAFLLYVCLAALFPFPAISTRKSAMSRHQLELKEHYDHLAKIAEFVCDLPQPRLLNVNELLSDFMTRGKAYFPEVTVLHRCDRHVGSCNDASHHCGPTVTSDVRMPFKVTFLEAMGGHAKGEWQMEYHTLQNHTVCGCVKSPAVPPSKTAVHFHYVDPSLVPPQTLPLEPTSDTPGNSSSYDVPLYRPDTQQGSGPSIYDMTKLAEEEVQPKPNEYDTKPEGEVQAKPNEYKPEVQPKPDENDNKPEKETPKTNEESEPRPDEGTQYETSYSGSETSSTPEAPLPEAPNNCDDNDADSTTITSELIRFGVEERSRSEALKKTDSDSPYDAYLRQAF